MAELLYFQVMVFTPAFVKLLRGIAGGICEALRMRAKRRRRMKEFVFVCLFVRMLDSVQFLKFFFWSLIPPGAGCLILHKLRRRKERNGCPKLLVYFVLLRGLCGPGILGPRMLLRSTQGRHKGHEVKFFSLLSKSHSC